MRLPRPQISLKTILFAVAVFAVNCAVYRYVCEKNGNFREDLLLSLFSNGFVEGVIPLLNVAMIGSLVWMTSRLRSIRRRPVPNPRSSPAGVTYFSLHFLAVCCVASIFMQETSDEVLRPALEHIPRRWLEALEACAPDVLFIPVVFGILISGPPLLLSWIGALLARRCAATVTRHRFRLMTSLVSFGFASVAMAIWVLPRPFAGDLDVDLDFRVVDKDSRQPIASAYVRMTDPFDLYSRPPAALTGPDGRARLTGRLPGSGEHSAFLTFGVFSPWGRWLEIAAPNFQTARIPLPQVLGQHVVLGETPIQTVALTKGMTSANSFREIAGRYTQPLGMGGSGFTIEPDGRFAWYVVGCRVQYLEYGFLKRTGETIELVTISHPGRETHPEMALKFRVVGWGQRFYFSTDESRNLQYFCRASLTPNRPRSYGPHSYCRESNAEKPETGLPRLPTSVWVTFLLNELSPRNNNDLGKPCTDL